MKGGPHKGADGGADLLGGGQGCRIGPPAGAGDMRGAGRWTVLGEIEAGGGQLSVGTWVPWEQPPIC